MAKYTVVIKEVVIHTLKVDAICEDMALEYAYLNLADAKAGYEVISEEVNLVEGV